MFSSFARLALISLLGVSSIRTLELSTSSFSSSLSSSSSVSFVDARAPPRLSFNGLIRKLSEIEVKLDQLQMMESYDLKYRDADSDDAEYGEDEDADAAAAAGDSAFFSAGNIVSSVSNARTNYHRNKALDILEGRTPEPTVTHEQALDWIGSLPDRQSAMTMANSHIDAHKVYTDKRNERKARAKAAE